MKPAKILWQRKYEVCKRSYKILTEQVGFPSEDIIDPNIFAVATGIEEHARYGLDFIEATADINKIYATQKLAVKAIIFSAATNRCAKLCYSFIMRFRLVWIWNCECWSTRRLRGFTSGF